MNKVIVLFPVYMPCFDLTVILLPLTCSTSYSFLSVPIMGFDGNLCLDYVYMTIFSFMIGNYTKPIKHTKLYLISSFKLNPLNMKT